MSWNFNSGGGKSVSHGYDPHFRLADLGDGVVLEEYISTTASTGRNYFATTRDGKRFFGCNPDLLFEMDEKTYGTIQPVCESGGIPVFDGSRRTLQEIGNPDETFVVPVGIFGGEVAFARKGCEFYADQDGQGFRQVRAAEYYTIRGMADPPRRER